MEEEERDNLSASNGAAKVKGLPSRERDRGATVFKRRDPSHRASTRRHTGTNCQHAAFWRSRLGVRFPRKSMIQGGDGSKPAVKTCKRPFTSVRKTYEKKERGARADCGSPRLSNTLNPAAPPRPSSQIRHFKSF